MLWSKCTVLYLTWFRLRPQFWGHVYGTSKAPTDATYLTFGWDKAWGSSELQQSLQLDPSPWLVVMCKEGKCVGIWSVFVLLSSQCSPGPVVELFMLANLNDWLNAGSSRSVGRVVVCEPQRWGITLKVAKDQHMACDLAPTSVSQHNSTVFCVILFYNLQCFTSDDGFRGKKRGKKWINEHDDFNFG